MTEGSMEQIEAISKKRRGPQFPGYPGVYRMAGSQFLHVAYSWRGRLFRESAHTTSVKKAAEFRRERLAGLKAGTFKSPKQDDIKLGRIFDDYLEARAKKRAIRTMRVKLIGQDRRHPARKGPSIKESIGHVRVADLSLPFLTKWANQREAMGYSAGTVSSDLGLIRAALRYAVRAGTIAPGAVPPFPIIEFDNARQVTIEDVEAEELEPMFLVRPNGKPRKHGAMLRDLVAFHRLSGWRTGECKALPWARVNREERVAILPATGSKKRKKPRLLALDHRLPNGQWANTELWQLMERRWRDRVVGNFICPWVFHRDGRVVKEFRHVWRQACRMADLHDKRPHDFRRSAVGENEYAGVSRKAGKERTGHLTDLVYERYHIVNPEEQREALVRLEAYRARRRAIRAENAIHNAEGPVPICST
jgi:integrase